jgi:hypothetical protein
MLSWEIIRRKSGGFFRAFRDFRGQILLLIQYNIINLS